MMTKEELQNLEARLMELLVQRRRLGGYNSEAESVLLLTEAIFKVVQHINSSTKRPNKNDKVRKT